MVEVSFLIDRVGSPLIALKVVPDIRLVPQTGIVNVLFPAILSIREERLEKHPRSIFDLSDEFRYPSEFGRIIPRKKVIRSRKKSN